MDDINIQTIKQPMSSDSYLSRVSLHGFCQLFTSHKQITVSKSVNFTKNIKFFIILEIVNLYNCLSTVCFLGFLQIESHRKDLQNLVGKFFYISFDLVMEKYTLVFPWLCFLFLKDEYN